MDARNYSHFDPKIARLAFRHFEGSPVMNASFSFQGYWPVKAGPAQT
jgi:hypothetical protein